MSDTTPSSSERWPEKSLQAFDDMAQPSSIPATGPPPNGSARPSPNASVGIPFAGAQRVPSPGWLQRLWRFWLWLTAPSPSDTPPDARTRERLRRSHLLSILLLALAMILIALFPKSFIPGFDLGALSGIILGAIFIIVSAFFNRSGYTTVAGTIFVTGMAAAIAWSLIGTPNGLAMQDLSTFDLFVVPVVIAGILLPRRASFAMWAGCVIFIVADISLQTRQGDLATYIRQAGLYATVILPIVSTGILAVVSWLAAGSVERAIAEADRSAELQHAYQLLTEQKHRLEESMATIQGVHARVANGNLSARAPITGDEFLPLAVSLNLMLDRLARSATAEQTLGELEQGIQYLHKAVLELVQGHLNHPISPVGLKGMEALAINLEHLRRTLLEILQRGYALIDHLLVTSNGLMDPVRQLDQRAQETNQAVHMLLSAVQNMNEQLHHAQRDLGTLGEWLDHLPTQVHEGKVLVRMPEIRALANTFHQGLNALDESIALLWRTTAQIAALPSASGTPQPRRELADRISLADQEVRSTISQLRTLLARFTTDLTP